MIFRVSWTLLKKSAAVLFQKEVPKMGILRDIVTIFRSDHDGGSTKITPKGESRTGSKVSSVPGGGHVHQTYNQNISRGTYSEYHGGEKDPNRSNNK